MFYNTFPYYFNKIIINAGMGWKATKTFIDIFCLDTDN